MKILGVILSLLSSLSFAQSYNCKNYYLGDDQFDENVSQFQMQINLESKKAMIAHGENIVEGAVKSDSNGFMVSSGSGTDRVEYYLVTNTEFNFLTEYVNRISERFALTQSDRALLEANINQLFGEKNINGSIVILGNVASFLSCSEF